MIGIILKGLELTDSNNEFIQIAKGKYKYPESVKEAFNKFKKEMQWQKS